MAVEFRLLGAVELGAGDRWARLARRQERCVLAILLLEAGHVVPLDRLAELLWAGHPPGGAGDALRTCLSRLRRTLGTSAAGAVPPPVVGRGGGYLLDVDPQAVDAHRFDVLVAQAQAAAGPQQQAALFRQALALWRGPALADVGPAQVRERLAMPLEQRRAHALDLRITADLAAGQDASLISELTGLVAADPLDENLAGHLMLAQYRAGRRHNSLQTYQALTRQLRGDLGLDPGPKLRQLHTAILRDDPALRAGGAAHGEPAGAVTAGPSPVPAQLPAAPHGFAGRAAQLAALDALAARGDDRHLALVVISAISGMPGVGKTALALHWAHRAADRFPDGHLYVNLRGFDPAVPAMRPAEALRGFLDALGVPPERIPPRLDAQAALYRSLLAGKRMLVVLDNARDASQVRPLLPSTTALVLVTSRNQLTSLAAAEGAHPLSLDVLSGAEARQLLAGRLGSARVRAEPAAVERIITACAALPLALTIAAARARQTGFPLATLATELGTTGQRLDALDGGDAVSQVRTVFSWSYTALTLAAARLFRLLGRHPGPDISAPAAASLAGLLMPQVRPLLAELVRASLLAEPTVGRYTCHDLLRTYAMDLTRAHDTSDERRAATARLLDHYVHTAYHCDRLMDPKRDPVTLPLTSPADGARPEQIGDRQQAMAWLAAEHRVLLAALRLATAAGADTHAWHLAWALDTYLDRSGNWHDMMVAWRTAGRAARRLGETIARAVAESLLAYAYIRLGRHRAGQARLERSLELYLRAGDQAGQANAHRHLGYLWEQQGQYAKARDHAQQALALLQGTGNRRARAGALNGLGWCHAELGDHAQALACCGQALALFRELGDRYGEASAWDSLGYTHHLTGDYAEAASCYQQALALVRDIADRYSEATTLTHLGETRRAAADPAAARIAWLDALAILTDLDHPDAPRVRAKLGTLGKLPAAACDPGPSHA